MIIRVKLESQICNKRIVKDSQYYIQLNNEYLIFVIIDTFGTKLSEITEQTLSACANFFVGVLLLFFVLFVKR